MMAGTTNRTIAIAAAAGQRRRSRTVAAEAMNQGAIAPITTVRAR